MRCVDHYACLVGVTIIMLPEDDTSCCPLKRLWLEEERETHSTCCSFMCAQLDTIEVCCFLVYQSSWNQAVPRFRRPLVSLTHTPATYSSSTELWAKNIVTGACMCSFFAPLASNCMCFYRLESSLVFFYRSPVVTTMPYKSNVITRLCARCTGLDLQGTRGV